MAKAQSIKAQSQEIHPLPVSRTLDELRLQLVGLGLWTFLPHTTSRAHWLHEGEQRLDAGYYSNDAFSALQIASDSGFEVQELGQPDVTQDVFVLGRFRRVYATDSESGWPYLSASEALTFRPTSDRSIARSHAPRNAQRHFVKEGWILVSCSGSVGRVAMATRRMEKFFLTHDLVRVVPNPSLPSGYVHAYLASPIGQALLSKDQYGSAIKHLEPHHIAAVPVPLLPQQEQQSIHREVMRAYKLRDEANDLLDEADELLHRELSLPRFDEGLIPYLTPPVNPREFLTEMPHPRAFSVRASDLGDRLDGSYHVPIAKTATDLLNAGRYAPVKLGQFAGEGNIAIPPRFKRIYVTKEHGIPFIRPSHLPQLRPHDMGYISKKTAVLDSLLLNQGEVLITTDGTVGRIALVSSHIAGWAGSNNIARITYGNSNNSNGYLAAFLSTPYGFHQLNREIYGAVIDHIEIPHIQNVWIPDAPVEVQSAIGKKVVQAYEKKDEATLIEHMAIKHLESLLKNPQKPKELMPAVPLHHVLAT